MESTYLFLLTCLAIYIAFKVRRISRLSPRRIHPGPWISRLFGSSLSEHASFSMLIPKSEGDLRERIDYKLTNIGLVKSITLDVIGIYTFPHKNPYYLGEMNLISTETITPSAPQGEMEVETFITPNGAVRRFSGTAYLSPLAFEFILNELAKGCSIGLSIYGRRRRVRTKFQKVTAREFKIVPSGHPNGTYSFLMALERHMDEMDPEYNAPLFEFLKEYELMGHRREDEDDE